MTVTGLMISAALLVSAGIGGLFGVIGRTGIGRTGTSRPIRAEVPPEQPAGGPGRDLDVEDVLRAAAAKAEAAASGQFARVDIAVRPGLSVRANPAMLSAMLDDLMIGALRDPSCRRVLLSAVHQAGRMRIAVSDDGTASVTPARQAELCHVRALVAMQGGTMQIDARPGAGATVALRLPMPLAPVIHRTAGRHEDRSDAREPLSEPAVRPQPVQAGDF